MIMLHRVNCLSITIGKTSEPPLQFGSPAEVQQPTQPPFPILNAKVTIPLKYLWIVIFVDNSIYHHKL